MNSHLIPCQPALPIPAPAPFETLVQGNYGLIYADPPWLFELRSEKGEGRSPQAHYDCMPTDEICALPVAELAARDCALVMWATAPMLPDAFKVLDAWGFSYATAGAWAKQSRTGRKWAFGGGFILRSAAEFILVGTRGDPKPRSKSIRNLVVAPVREHSRKPDCFPRDLQRLFGGPYLELFTRTRRPGWDVWGDQIEKFPEATDD